MAAAAEYLPQNTYIHSLTARSRLGAVRIAGFL
jgi:hypothetical protein